MKVQISTDGNIRGHHQMTDQVMGSVEDALSRISDCVTRVLWNLAIILALLWAIGLVTSYTLSGFIHVLIVAAIVLAMIRIIQNASRARGNGKLRRHKRRTP